MAIQKDIIGIKDGDFEVGEDTAVRFEFALNSGVGHWLQYPLQGADIKRLTNAKVGRLEIETPITKALTEDGATNVVIKLKPNGDYELSATPPEI